MMGSSHTIILLGIVLVSFLSAEGGAKPIVLPLPSYIGKGCNPNLTYNELNKCAIKKGQPAIPKIVQGDPQYKIPKLDPLEIPSIKINQGTKQVGMKMDCTNCQLRGLRNTKLVAARMDLKKRHMEWDFKLPRSEIIGHYNVSGKILLLPIHGNGLANISLTGVNFTFAFDYDLQKKENGKDYVNLREGSKITIGVENMKIRLENLFNGDKLLGENMNEFMNENWKELLKELVPALSEATGLIFKNVMNSFSALVPYDVFFPTK